MNLFDSFPEAENKPAKNELTLIEGKNSDSGDTTISVDYMNYQHTEQVQCRSLFMGYDSLRVITYSYGVPFISDIMHYFKTGEVIIGSPNMINADAAEIFATQQFDVNTIVKNKYIQERVKNDEFHFYVLHDGGSHAKVYLLKSADGRYRVITGSANCSLRAWDGSQVENICVVDSKEYYNKWNDYFDLLLETATDKIAKDAKVIKEDGSNIDEIPIIKEIRKADKAVVVHDDRTEAEKEYYFKCGSLSDKMRGLLEKAHIHADKKSGNTLLTAKSCTYLINVIHKTLNNKKREMVNTNLLIDYQNSKMSLNDESFDLYPSRESVGGDIDVLMEYISGFGEFTGDTGRLKMTAWKVLNYMFLSPFIARLRFEGNQHGFEERFFPMYLILCGPKDDGKTGMVRMFQKMMLNIIPDKLGIKDFSEKKIRPMDENVHGCPILFDDLTNQKWKYANDIIKTDYILLDLHLLNHPTYIITSNEIKSVKPEISKRVIVLNIDNQLDIETAARKSSWLATMQKKMTNAFYREYVRRMFPKVDALIDEMADIHEQQDYIPDIFNVSANTIIEIMTDFGFTVPNELIHFHWLDYMGDQPIAYNSIKYLRDFYGTHRKCFTASRKDNTLIIDFAELNRRADEVIKMLCNQLPVSTERRNCGTQLIMKLDATEKFLGIRFKSRLFR